jgi:hypothetical protein
MTVSSRRFGTVPALCMAMLCAPVAGDAAERVEDKGSFDLVMMGLTAGRLTFAGTQDGNVYAVGGELKSAGLLSLVRKVSYTASARGSVTDAGVFTPSSYSEKADTGSRQSESVMEYAGGVPKVKVYNPPRPPRKQDVDPASQGGTVDPLTALYATLRDVDKGQECAVNVRMFDGKRASLLELSAPRRTGDKVQCDGEYRRVAGFSAKEMAEKVHFPFTLTYAPTDDGRMRVIDVSMDTLYGKARLTRR